MSAAKHTQGPWRIDLEDGSIGGCRTVSAEGRAIASTDGLFDDDEDRANALLIAAAPELLAHLVIVRLHLARGDFCSNPSLASEALHHIDKTVARATGSAA